MRYLKFILLLYMLISNQCTSAQEKHIVFKDVGSALQHPTEVIELDIFNDGLYDNFPSDIFRLKYLRVLTIRGNECTPYKDIISCNQIEEIPRNIEELKHLEELYLVANKIKKVPQVLGELKKLRVVDFSDNYGIDLTNIGNLKNLESLNLNNCNLTNIPNSICELQKLKVLGLDLNSIPERQIKHLQSCLPQCEISY